MNIVGQILREAREATGTTLRGMAERSDHFSKSILSDLEVGRREMKADEIPTLAKLYNVREQILLEALERAARRRGSSPVSVEPFLDILHEAHERDHIVVVAQKSIVLDDADLPARLVELAAQPVPITYVAGILPPEIQDDRWQNNHKQAARLLFQEARTSGREECLHHIHYLFISAPSSQDFAFLRPYDAAIYLRRNTPSLEDSHVWIEVELEPGKYWWTPAGHKFQADLDYWLVQECGLLLPTSKWQPRNNSSAAEREVSFQTLVEFLGHDTSERTRAIGPAKERHK